MYHGVIGRLRWEISPVQVSVGHQQSFLRVGGSLPTDTSKVGWVCDQKLVHALWIGWRTNRRVRGV